MSDYFEDEQMQLPSLWRVKLEAYFWTLLFGAVFFVAFYSIRGSLQISNPFQGLMQPQEWTMTIVFLGAITCTLAFNKVYYLFNREVFQSNTQTLRLNSKKLDDIYSKVSKNELNIQEMHEVLITYADKIPDFKPFPEVDMEAKL